MNVDFRAFRTTALINDSPIATCPLVAKRITSGDAVFPGTVNLQTTGTIVNCPDPINPTDVANLQTVQSAAQDVLDGYFSAKGDLLVGTSQIGFLPAIEPATGNVLISTCRSYGSACSALPASPTDWRYKNAAPLAYPSPR